MSADTTFRLGYKHSHKCYECGRKASFVEILATFDPVKKYFWCKRHAQGVAVCDSCGDEQCWQGNFYCEDYKKAGVKVRRVPSDPCHLHILPVILNN